MEVESSVSGTQSVLGAYEIKSLAFSLWKPWYITVLYFFLAPT